MLIAAIVALTLTAGADVTRVYVGPKTTQGFVDTDAGIRDAVADVQKELRNDHSISIVHTPAEADVVLEIVARRVLPTPGGAPMVIGPTTVVVPFAEHAIDVVIHVGAYEKAVTSEEHGSGTWTAAAKQTAKDFRAWLSANRAQIGK